ncbi:LysR family transcriptional regulator [Sphingomonas sp. C3-2]|uniref:LysR family transcriptional regulator n=1 Tax=Sphingomonas sp. C3-2 TaxID=3062169 RepID=UPI00294AAEB8|nr:LysR family transcriptional regulator [Sphingomonas sp. C3-2]WOK36101.1 LysR family transcriptional regulator [Sphingomonas sp. C3-2]
MSHPDLNLLIALDILLEEESVAAAAQRMNLSAPAMSRTLARIRDTLGDPILVRAGKKLVPTPRALKMRERIHAVTADALELLQRVSEQGLETIERQFTIRANDVFVAAVMPVLLRKLRESAPGVLLRSIPESDLDDDALRQGRVDLFVGGTEKLPPEVRVQTLFTTYYVGLARAGHPLFDGPVTPERLASYEHISVSRRGARTGPIDDALAAHGLHRTVAMIAWNFSSAMFALPDTDFILPVPRHMIWGLDKLHTDLRAFELPLDLPRVAIRQAWHPRFDNDAVHRWLRRMVLTVCGRMAAAQELALERGSGALSFPVE